MPLNNAKELNLGEIIPSNITLTLVDLSITHPHGVLQDVLVHVASLFFPADFMVVDLKGYICGSVVLRHLFLVAWKALIDLETCELSLNLNN